ncbi:tripartite tricarboxylate transporter substrate binding protein [Muricoccus aerilatus]|uniref:tripartite tricarboxylate transporter substrate binding protein n=1 Tax=Muricoccus aerilatus TaxID=452982 RepID=UPI0006937DA3|nr:tripartite tricarboxylate transporter substrate binding protein [Roseomonas aerilata]
MATSSGLVAQRRTVMGSGLVALFAPSVLRAQEDWPRRPIRIIIPYTPGGGTDIVTRLFGEAMRVTLGQPVVIENRPGANGVIGTDLVARAQPDGYTLVSVTAGHVGNKYTIPSIPHDAVKDFTAVSLIANYPLVVTAGMQAPFPDFPGMIAYARASPRAVSYGTTTSTSSYAAAELARLAGLQMTEVPYRGSAPMMTDMMSGALNAGWSSPESAFAQIQSGKTRVIAQTGARRAEALAAVPTVAEMGFPGFEMLGWVGLYGPAGLPPQICNRIYSALTEAVAKPVLHQRLVEMGNFGVIEGPTEFARRTLEDDARLGRAAREGLLVRAG